MSIDRLDADLLELLHAEPRVGVLEASRRLGVARGTVQARLTRLEREGVIESLAPTLNAEALGFPVTAFATLEIVQGRGTARWSSTSPRSPRCSRPTPPPARATC